ncbi:MAG: hypothetical protein JST10_10180 [Bacteroidetes bacterium]|nr:hypothetical protein [Bacteroidota bacterium]
MNHTFPFLTLQISASLISLLGALLVIAVVLFLIFTSSVQEDKSSVKHKVYKFRGKYFLILSLTIVILLFTSLRLLPYPRFQDTADETVSVVGMQWLWKMAPGVSNESPAAFKGKNEITLPVNKTIRFVVTSADVNHNFAIYNSSGVLLTQTQAMPQYKNKLQYMFTEKGDYEILCLEFCGLAHAIMTAKIHVE